MTNTEIIENAPFKAWKFYFVKSEMQVPSYLVKIGGIWHYWNYQNRGLEPFYTNFLSDNFISLRSRTDIEALAKAEKAMLFAREMINGAFEGGGFEGCDIQEIAEGFGLINATTFNPEIHTCDWGEAEEGDPWYEYDKDFLVVTNELIKERK